MGELSFCCIFVCSPFPEFQPINRHTCGANSSLCITVVGLSPGIRPVGAGLFPPTWVAGANSSATEVSPEPTPAGHRDGSMWGRDATGPEPTPAPRWFRISDQAPSAKPLSPTVPIQSDAGTGAYSALERGVFGWFPVVVVVGLPTMPGLCAIASAALSPELREQRRPALASLFPPPAPRVYVGSNNGCINLFNVIWGCGECLIYFNP
jgi:hypothetical protein